MSDSGLRFALHGGAGAKAGYDYTVVIAHMRGLVESGRDRLRAGAAAIDVAMETVAVLESVGTVHCWTGCLAKSGRRVRTRCLFDGWLNQQSGSSRGLARIRKPHPGGACSDGFYASRPARGRR